MTRRRNSAFTLVEILTVVGIIAILIGLVVVGVGHVSKQAKQKQTLVTLGNLQSAIAELEATAGSNRQPSYMYYPSGTKSAATDTLNFWKDADPVNTTAPEPDSLPSPGSVANTDATSINNRYDSIAVLNTQQALATLGSSPKNRTALSSVPQESLLEKVPSPYKGTTRLILSAAPGTEPAAPNPPLQIDAWGNPIIFVPAGGLSGVIYEADAPATHIVTSGGVIASSATAVPAGVRGFFASAGPDGDFTKGDDNVYSFEN